MRKLLAKIKYQLAGGMILASLATIFTVVFAIKFVLAVAVLVGIVGIIICVLKAVVYKQ